ncbi:serine/threonine-protein kinase [Micromonospora carbonacea]|uniref:serine/threonine-protein kinase n=1 Tax=Micromonospora carbonacea TaxID=47853 RepID=UPI003D750208
MKAVIGGAAEVAELLGISRQRVLKLRERPDFPDPIGTLKQGEVWDLDEIAAWNGSGLRQSTSGRPSAEEMAKTLGGRFLLDDKIESGGHADVFRAVDKKKSGDIPAMVAIKILKDLSALDPELVRRFKRELRMLDEELAHPHIVRILGHGETDDGRIWYSMPLAIGSLRSRFGEIAQHPALIVDLMRQVCAGLEYIHSKDICHRDLKPANILALDSGTWAISDFGLAFQAGRDSTVVTSTFRMGLGTQIYAAPEQLRNARSADHRSDIYSLGKVLQELLTNDLPVSIIDMPPGPFRAIVERATEQDPARRYQSARDFLTAVEQAVETPKSQWETPDEAAKRIVDLITDSAGDYSSLKVLITWAEGLDENDNDEMSALAKALPRLSRDSIQEIFENDEDAFRRIYRRYTDHVGASSFAWEACDGLANFGKRVTLATRDPGLLRMTVASLANLGERHNRWHVRDTLTEILQGVRRTDSALAASEGLEAARPLAVEWSLTDFAIKSLHPILRARVEKILEE